MTLARTDIGFIIPNRRVPAKLPEILSREEVQRILDACSNLRRRALLTTTYAAGLRVTETCSLKVSDIDSDRMMLRVSGGKGGKDRYTLLSPAWRCKWTFSLPSCPAIDHGPSLRGDT